MSIKKICLRIMVLVLICTVLTSTVYAKEATQEEETTYYVCIQSKYGSIEPQDKDDFVITYQDSEKNIKEISIDASSIAADAKVMELDKGSYTITSIIYKGSNSVIETAGYAVVTTFSAQKNGSSYITIAIGKEAISQLEQTYDNIMIRQNGEYVSSVLSTDETAETSLSTETSGNTEEQDTSQSVNESEEESVSEYTGTENLRSKNTEKLIVEDYRDNYQDDSKEDDGNLDLFFRIIPLLVISVIFGIGVYIAHKNGNI